MQAAAAELSAVILAKTKLRVEMKTLVAGMTTSERQRQSEIITQKVLKCPYYKNSDRICLYLSMDDEVSTLDIVQHIFSAGKMCFIPRYTKTEMTMLRLYSYDDYLALPVNNWNIKQPESSEGREEALSSGGLDLMLVPGLAFTTRGERLGRGKGYYDTYLRKCEKVQNPPISVGLAFKQQVVQEIPTVEIDCSLNCVIYPNDE